MKENILNDNNFGDFIKNLTIDKEIKNNIIDYFDNLIYEKKVLSSNLDEFYEKNEELGEENYDLERENNDLIKANKQLQYYNDIYTKDYEDMLKIGYNVTLLDDMKSQILKENWQKITLEKLDNFIKSL